MVKLGKNRFEHAIERGLVENLVALQSKQESARDTQIVQARSIGADLERAPVPLPGLVGGWPANASCRLIRSLGEADQSRADLCLVSV
jgi:hypothetical protein